MVSVVEAWSRNELREVGGEASERSALTPQVQGLSHSEPHQSPLGGSVKIVEGLIAAVQVESIGITIVARRYHFMIAASYLRSALPLAMRRQADGYGVLSALTPVGVFRLWSLGRGSFRTLCLALTKPGVFNVEFLALLTNKICPTVFQDRFLLSPPHCWPGFSAIPIVINEGLMKFLRLKR